MAKTLIDGKIPENSQEGKILRWLKTGRPITPLEAMRELGCFRLGARIWNLRNKGYNIITIMKEETKEDGSVCRFASYSLQEGEAYVSGCSA